MKATRHKTQRSAPDQQHPQQVRTIPGSPQQQEQDNGDQYNNNPNSRSPSAIQQVTGHTTAAYNCRAQFTPPQLNNRKPQNAHAENRTGVSFVITLA